MSQGLEESIRDGPKCRHQTETTISSTDFIYTGTGDNKLAKLHKLNFFMN